MKKSPSPTSFLLALLLLASSAFAWSGKEHIQITRIAMERLLADPATPPAMKDWLKQIMPNVFDLKQEEAFYMTGHIGNTDGTGLTGIEYWVVAPDIHAQKDPKGTEIKPFGVAELPMHFIDLELFVQGDKPRKYMHDLSSKPKLEDIPHDMKDPRFMQAGMLPFGIEWCYKNFVTAVKAGKLLPKDPKSTDLADDSALRWGGYLCHYVEDNTQPLHATMDYKAESYFAVKRRDRNVHAETEYVMVDGDKENFPELRAKFFPMFLKEIDAIKDPGETKDLFKGTLEVSLKSYDAIPLIGLAAMKATGQAGTPDKPLGKAGPIDTTAFFNFEGEVDGKKMTVLEMKAHQTAWAVRRAEVILRQAWEEAGK